MQIANEGGFLPQLAKNEALPSTFVTDLGAINITNFLDGGVYSAMPSEPTWWSTSRSSRARR